MNRWRSTELTLASGTGLIAIRRSNGSGSLLFDGRPLGLSWPLHDGSIGQYIALRQSDAAVQINDWPGLSEVIDLGGLTEQQYASLLQPFENGRYVIDIVRQSAEEFRQGEPMGIAEPSAAYHPDRVPNRPFFVDFWYPGGEEADVFETVSPSAIDPDTVGSYRRKIIEGYEPVVVVAGGPLGGVRYLLDGHHRLAAYCELLVAHHTPMPALCWVSVRRLDAPPLDEESSFQFLAEADAAERAPELRTEINGKGGMAAMPDGESKNKNILERFSEAWRKRQG